MPGSHRKSMYGESEPDGRLGLRIESADGKVVRVRFRSPVLPETVDSIG